MNFKIVKNSLILAFIYIGTIIGAGFASGKELFNFFAKFKQNGIIGFFITSILIGLSFIAILTLIKKSNSTSYKDFLIEIFGYKIGSFLEILNICFLFILFSSMISAGATIFQDILQVNFVTCVLVFSLVIFISLLFNEKAIIIINSILCPTLIIGGAFIGAYIYFFATKQTFSISNNFVVQSVIYTSYNIITTISVLFGLKHIINDKKTIIIGGILSSIFVFFIGIFLVLSLIYNYNVVVNRPLPIFYIIKNIKYIKEIYLTVILAAIYTTAVANGFAIFKIVDNKFKNKNLIKSIFFIFAMFFAFIGFSNIVGIVYPIFGYLGLFQLIIIFFIAFFNVK